MLMRISFLLVASSNLMHKCLMDFGLQEPEKIITKVFAAHLLKVICMHGGIKSKACLGHQIAIIIIIFYFRDKAEKKKNDTQK